MPGGTPPRTPPNSDVTGPFPLSLFSYRKLDSFLANQRENIFSGLTVKVITRQPNKQMAGLVPLVCT